MKAINKILVYVACIIYIATSIFIIHFGDNVTIHSSLLSNILLLFSLPGALIAIALAFFWGVAGEIMGIIISVIIVAITIERVYKRANSKNKGKGV